jgi:hypothetical protein
MKTIAVIAMIAGSLALTGCLQDQSTTPFGKYKSQDDFGVMFFKDDGTFHYKFAAKFDFYNASNLPPRRGTFRVNDTGEIDILTIEKGDRAFRIQWYPESNSFDLIRTEPNGTLPSKARYKKDG